MTFIPKIITKPESDQDAFNRAWDHAMVRQAPHCAKGQVGMRTCAYRKQGNCCIIGAMMPTRMARVADIAAFDHCGSIANLIQGRASFTEWFAACTLTLLVDLQQIHDDAEDNYEYRRTVEDDLRDIAERYQLQIPV